MADGSDIVDLREARTVKALRDPDPSMAKVPNTIRQAIADVIEEQRAELERLRAQAPGWRGVESAPKNRPVLLYKKAKGKGAYHSREYLLVGEWRSTGYEPSLCWCALNGRELDGIPDFWQPLPSPPAEGGMCSPASGLGGPASDRSAQ